MSALTLQEMPNRINASRNPPFTLHLQTVQILLQWVEWDPFLATLVTFFHVRTLCSSAFLNGTKVGLTQDRIRLHLVLYTSSDIQSCSRNETSMPSRQHANPLIIRGLTQDPAGHVTKLLPISSSGKESTFDEKWFQELLFKFPSLLPAAEIESAFHSLEAVAKELPIAGNWADLLFVNRDGCITLIETKPATFEATTRSRIRHR